MTYVENCREPTICYEKKVYFIRCAKANVGVIRNSSDDTSDDTGDDSGVQYIF